MLLWIFNQIISLKTTWEHSAAPLALATCSHQLCKDSAKLVGQKSESIICLTMDCNQMSQEPVKGDLLLTKEAVVAQHFLQCGIVPNLVKISSHQGHGHLLQGLQGQQGLQHCR